MARVKRTVIGVSELNAQLRRIRQAISPPEMANIMLLGAEIGAESVQEHILKQDLFVSGDLYDAVKAIKINQHSAGVLVDIVYAAPHEFGAVIRVPVTAKSRSFFWLEYYATGDEKWKAMALSDKEFFDVEIPARPYCRPGIDEAKPAMISRIQHEIRQRIRRAK